MGDRRAEDHGLPVAGLLAPVPDDLVRDRGAVHDLRHRAHVVVGRGLADRAQLLLHADIDHEGARRHEVTRGDQFGQRDLVADIVEDLAQPLPVAAVGRRRDAEDPTRRDLRRARGR
jgi:hypothetical protein